MNWKVSVRRAATLRAYFDLTYATQYHLNYLMFYNNFTPLMVASNSGHIEICELLINRGDVNHKLKGNVYDVTY
jgi:ankyrin repeat protein